MAHLPRVITACLHRHGTRDGVVCRERTCPREALPEQPLHLRGLINTVISKPEQTTQAWVMAKFQCSEDFGGMTGSQAHLTVHAQDNLTCICARCGISVYACDSP